MNKKISYSASGVDYQSLDPVKKLAQSAALKTATNLGINGFSEIGDTRGESAYVWEQGDFLMASVIEGLGTKNLVADAMRKITRKTYYENIGYDAVSAIINDLISVGARPLVIHAYWAVGESSWFDDIERTEDLVKGWKSACDDSSVSWGGGETPTYKGIINPETIDLAGSAVGIIKDKNQLVTDRKIKEGDRIILLKSTGINVNGLSLARAVAEKLPEKYSTKVDGRYYGDLLLEKSNIYTKLISNLLDEGVNIHYLSNITGHGFRKIMRGKPEFTYMIENIFEPQEVFNFIQEHSGLDDREMYQTYNMGQDYAIFVDKSDIEKVLGIVQKNGFEALDAGVVQKGPKQVIIKTKNLTYTSETLDLR